VLATAGSAVGLGNVWRFPYMAGQNGGAAFILIYLGCILILGIPGMISEFIVGRHSQTNAARSYATFSKSKGWGLIGILGIITSTIILGFYAVVAGWCLYYLGASVIGHLKGDTAYVLQYFQNFSGDPVKPAVLGIVFILVTHFIIVRGVRNGIEKASKLLMPLLFILLLIIVVASCSLPNATKGIEFLLKPDFSVMNADVFLEALGQAFFSLSLGTACLCTYASYYSKHTKLLHSATHIALIDFLIALLAGLMIFPAAFSVGVQPDSGPSLIFITLPSVFQQAFAFMPVLGYVISILFYALLVFAALTSTISMHEIGTAFFHEELNMRRSNAAWILTIACSLIAVFCSLSVGQPDIQLFGKPLMDFCDLLTANILLPAGAMLTSILVGWFASKALVREEFTNWETSSAKSFFNYYMFCVRYIVPVCILLILMHQFGVI
jgi:NSS family neurotransmitter:Na+ symporter